MKKFLKENFVEILAVIVVFLGAIAFFRRDLASRLINLTLPEALDDLRNLISQLLNLARETFSRLSMYELVAISLAILGFLFIVFRIRYRFFRSQRWRSPACPRCGSELYRVHRSWFDRLLGKTLLPHSRRYLCQDPDCGWSGLKGIDRGRRRASSEVDHFGFDSSE